MALSKSRPGAYAICLVSLGWAGCGSPQEAGGAGAECYRILDCAEGFACIGNQCSKNLMAIEGETPEMAMPDAAVAVPADAAAPVDARGTGGAPSGGDAGAGTGGAPQGTGGAPAVGDAGPG